MAKRFKRLNLGEDKLQRFQDNVGTTLDSLTDVPFVSGNRLDDVVIAAANTTVNHLLGRELQGWFLLGKFADARVWEVSRNSTSIVLRASASVTVDIWVF